MKRWLIVAALLLGIGVVGTEAQGRFWVLVNGALRYTGSVFISGPLTVTGTCTGCGGSPLTVNNIVTTSTDGLVVQNTTAATSGVPVQMSPRTRWVGNAWDTSASETVAFFAEVLPATAATPTGVWQLGYSLNGAAATYPLTLASNGNLTALGSIVASGNVKAGANTALGWTGRSQLYSAADKIVQLLDNGGATGLEFNTGSATLGTCTGGTITAGSHNQAGGYTGNTSSSCIINFGTPNWTNAPFCVAMSIASTTHPRVSATSTSSITITGGVSGEAITYICQGRIGT